MTSQVTLFCTTCSDALCQHCLTSHQGHDLIQIRRYVYQDVIRAVDINPIIDVGSVQAYIINQAKVIFLNARPQAKVQVTSKGLGQPDASASASAASTTTECCRSCSRNLREGFLYCCLACKVQAVELGLDVATGSSSTLPLEPYIPGPTKFGSAVFRKPSNAPPKKAKCGRPSKPEASVNHLQAGVGQQADNCGGSNELGTSSEAPEAGGEGSGVGDQSSEGGEKSEPPSKRLCSHHGHQHQSKASKRVSGGSKKTADLKIAAAPTLLQPSEGIQSFLNFCPPGFFPFPMMLPNGLMFPAAVFQPMQTFPVFSGAWSMPSDLSCLLAQPPNGNNNNNNNHGDSGATSVQPRDDRAEMMTQGGEAFGAFRSSLAERSTGSSDSEGGACPVTTLGVHNNSSPLEACGGSQRNKRKMGQPKRAA